MLKMRNFLRSKMVLKLPNIMVIKYLQTRNWYEMSYVGGVRTLSFYASHRAVLQVPHKALSWIKRLVIRLLNNTYMIVDVIRCAYLCKSKSPILWQINI